MRTCNNCVFGQKQEKKISCLKSGEFVDDPCNDHQYPERLIRPVLDDAVALLDTFSITMSAMYERKVKKVIDNRDEFFG